MRSETGNKLPKDGFELLGLRKEVYTFTPRSAPGLKSVRGKVERVQVISMNTCKITLVDAVEIDTDGKEREVDKPVTITNATYPTWRKG